jgi:CMP-N-acetylneuraminic acid synthetase
MIPFCLIPARGGSKGIPRKNLQYVGAQSLLAECIAAAMGADCFDGRVYVSTEDGDIARAASEADCAFIRRPPELASDDATTENVIEHAIGFAFGLARAAGTPIPTHIVTLQCTAPFTEPSDITRCLEAVAPGTGYDSSFCAAKFHGKIWRDVDGVADSVNHNRLNPRAPRQAEPFQQYLEAGSVYCTSIAEFIKASPGASRFAGRTAIVEVPMERVMEIDAPWELERARLIQHG